MGGGQRPQYPGPLDIIFCAEVHRDASASVIKIFIVKLNSIISLRLPCLTEVFWTINGESKSSGV